MHLPRHDLNQMQAESMTYTVRHGSILFHQAVFYSAVCLCSLSLNRSCLVTCPQSAPGNPSPPRFGVPLAHTRYAGPSEPTSPQRGAAARVEGGSHPAPRMPRNLWADVVVPSSPGQPNSSLQARLLLPGPPSDSPSSLGAGGALSRELAHEAQLAFNTLASSLDGRPSHEEHKLELQLVGLGGQASPSFPTSPCRAGAGSSAPRTSAPPRVRSPGTQPSRPQGPSLALQSALRGLHSPSTSPPEQRHGKAQQQQQPQAQVRPSRGEQIRASAAALRSSVAEATGNPRSSSPTLAPVPRAAMPSLK